jgi:hypothetical protein
MKLARSLLIVGVILISFVSLGCNSLMGEDESGYPTKAKFDPFYTKYESCYQKIDSVLNEIEKNYALVKKEKMTVYDFKANFNSMKKTLQSEKSTLDSITTPNGINSQYSVSYLKTSCDDGIQAIEMFQSIPQNPNVGKINAFEDLLRKSIDAKNTSKEYTDSIKAKVR